jgi:protein-tyrosine phosphatase
MVDIHCHILPGIDDGSKSWEMTAEMCRVAAADGITHIVATPHANDVYAYDRERYTAMLGDLHGAAEGKLIFSLGCDFHFSYDNIQDALENPGRYTIGETQYLLIEFSDFSLPPSVKQNIFALRSRGLVPIITHPERNQALLQRPEMVLELVDEGCLVQVTANAVTGGWGKTSEKMVQWLLKRGAVHFVASDAHDPVRRKPMISAARDAIAAVTSAEIAESLVRHNPKAVVENRKLVTI